MNRDESREMNGERKRKKNEISKISGTKMKQEDKI